MCQLSVMRPFSTLTRSVALKAIGCPLPFCLGESSGEMAGEAHMHRDVVAKGRCGQRKRQRGQYCKSARLTGHGSAPDQRCVLGGHRCSLLAEHELQVDSRGRLDEDAPFTKLR